MRERDCSNGLCSEELTDNTDCNIQKCNVIIIPAVLALSTASSSNAPLIIGFDGKLKDINCLLIQ